MNVLKLTWPHFFFLGTFTIFGSLPSLLVVCVVLSFKFHNLIIVRFQSEWAMKKKQCTVKQKNRPLLKKLKTCLLRPYVSHMFASQHHRRKKEVRVRAIQWWSQSITSCTALTGVNGAANCLLKDTGGIRGHFASQSDFVSALVVRKFSSSSTSKWVKYFAILTVDNNVLMKAS